MTKPRRKFRRVWSRHAQDRLPSIRKLKEDVLKLHDHAVKLANKSESERLDFWIAHPQAQLWQENSGKWVCQFFVNGVIAKENNVCGVGLTAREAIDHAVTIACILRARALSRGDLTPVSAHNEPQHL